MTPHPHAALPPGCMDIGSTSMLDGTHNSSLGFTFLPPAFQLWSRKKQADAGVAPVPNPSGLPSVVLEVGDSESLKQLKIDARLWFETVFDVSQFLPSLLLTHQKFFRYSWSFFFRSTLLFRPPKSPNNDYTTVARLSPKSSSTFGSSSAKGSPHGLGSWLDAYCNTIVHTAFWHLQRTGTCSLWQQRSCAFGYCSLAAGYYWCMVIVIIFEHLFGIKISLYNTLLGYYPLLDQPPNHIINYEPLSLERRCKEWAQIMQRM